MKILFITALVLVSAALHAQIETTQTEPTQVMQTETINVDGYVSEKQSTDGELEGLKQEIQKQKTEVVLNKQKAKSYQELTKSVEKLSETTEEYLEEKRSAKAEIAAYNTKVKCLQAEVPGAECDKHVRRRN